MFESGREPDQPVANAELGALLRCQPLVRCGCRMRDKAFRVTEVVSDADEIERIEKTEGAFLSALDLERA